MRVLIVESNAALAGIWRAHLERLGAEVCLVTTQAEAIAVLQKRVIDVIVLNLMLAHGSALAVADYASYRQPGARVVFVTNTSFFSDGSIFRHVGNACAFLPTGIPPEDLAAVVDHYAMR